MTIRFAERTIPKFCGRKKQLWLFSGKVLEGAKLAELLYSIVGESAKSQWADPLQYILHLLKELSRHAGKV